MTSDYFWSLEPEVAGELGDGSVLDTSVYPPVVMKLQYRLSGWLGDDLLESFPCYIVTERVAKELQSASFTGFQLDEVDLVMSDEFNEKYPGCQLPQFRWLKVIGKAGVDDFGLSGEHKLVVSDRVLRAVRRHTLAQCDIDKYEG
jgi:hypothetical protein